MQLYMNYQGKNKAWDLASLPSSIQHFEMNLIIFGVLGHIKYHWFPTNNMHFSVYVSKPALSLSWCFLHETATFWRSVSVHRCRAAQYTTKYELCDVLSSRCIHPDSSPEPASFAQQVPTITSQPAMCHIQICEEPEEKFRLDTSHFTWSLNCYVGELLFEAFYGKFSKIHR